MAKSERNNKLLYYSEVFSDEVLALSRRLRRKGIERDLANQLMKAGTSVGANVSEAQQAQGRKDFVSKLEIASKECKETEHWISVLYRAGDIPYEDYLHFRNQWIRLQYLIAASAKTAKRNFDEEARKRREKRRQDVPSKTAEEFLNDL